MANESHDATVSATATVAGEAAALPYSASAREDLMTLTKARLSTLVAVTTVCGYFAALRGGGGGAENAMFSFWTLAHTLFGTLLAAFGAAVFNQVMEIDADGRMRRTENRPLPGRRISTGMAFGLGWLMSAMGIVHLGMKVNVAAAGWAAATLLTYLFIYTPLKRRSSLNTIVGAVAGAFPPLIGWGAGGGDPLAAGAWFLFSLLFWWQLPHFAAINWMYRDEYQRGGFVMWSNDDEDGARTSRLALWFSLAVTLLPVQAVVFGVTQWWFLIPGVLLGGLMLYLAAKFRRSRERGDARKLFFYTLLYLPLILIAALLAWTRV
jgi:protoheme IX farnesyltransferase